MGLSTTTEHGNAPATRQRPGAGRPDGVNVRQGSKALANGSHTMFIDYRRRSTGANARRAAEMDALRSLGQVVYLVRVEDCIKIGTTGNLHERLRNLHVKRTALLAVIPGGRDEELALHERFAASLHHGREWFTPTPDIFEYANQIRVAAGIAPVEV